MYTGKDDFFLYLHFIFKNKKKPLRKEWFYTYAEKNGLAIKK